MPVALKAPALYEHVAPDGQLVMVWPVRLVVSIVSATDTPLVAKPPLSFKVMVYCRVSPAA